MTFIGFIVNYMLRINLNITIVDMIAGVDGPPPALTSNQTNTSTALLGNASESNLASASVVESIQNGSARTQRYSWERQFLDWANVSTSRAAVGEWGWLHDALVTHAAHA